MALKKSQLYNSLWRSCDELRGGMDASQYKDYILTLLFVKYVTDKAKADRTSLIDVPPGGSFDAHTRQDQTVYDPACGSGSLLLKVAAEAPRGITIYGQEKDNATWALSKMNMILHGNEDAEIEKGDTLTTPHFSRGRELRTFDFAVVNPPFSLKSWSNGLELDYGRFEF